MITPTKKQIDPCLNCDSDTKAMCDYPCKERISYLYLIEKIERKNKSSKEGGKNA